MWVPQTQKMRSILNQGEVVKVGQMQTRVAEVEEEVPQGEGVGVLQGEVGVPQEGAVGMFYGVC